MCIENLDKLVLKIRKALFYYKMGQSILQIWAGQLFKIGMSIVTNWDSYQKLCQLFFQNHVVIKNWGKSSYKVEVLQPKVIIKIWDITVAL